MNAPQLMLGAARLQEPPKVIAQPLCQLPYRQSQPHRETIPDPAHFAYLLSTDEHALKFFRSPMQLPDVKLQTVWSGNCRRDSTRGKGLCG